MMLPICIVLCLMLSSMCCVNAFNYQNTKIVRASNTLRLQMTQKDDKPASSSQEFKKFKCISCSFEYDEKTGFKKRFPPGTKFEPLPTFACPVCGAAKDQFVEVKE